MVEKITKYSILELFLNDYSKRYYLREIALALGKPHQSIKSYVEALVSEGILLKEKRVNIIDYFLNLNSRKLIEYLVIAEKEKLFRKLKENKLLDVLFEKLSVCFNENTFVIFGSVVVDVKKSSDIDLLVVGKQNINKIIKEFGEVYNKRIHKVQIVSFNKLTLTLVKEIYKKHIILNNTSKVVNFFINEYEKNKLV